MRAVAWRLSAGVLALTVTAAPLSAAAQSAIPQLVPGERVQEVDLIAQLIYDSNVTGANADLANRRRLKPSDVIFEPAIDFSLARPIGRNTVYLQGSAGYDVFFRNSVLNRERLDIRPGVLSQIGICQTGLGGQYSRAQSDLNELALSPTGVPIPFQRQNVIQVEEIAANANCGRATGLAPNANVSETWTNNSSPIQRFTDAQTFSASAGLAYRRPVLGSVSLFGAFSHTDYPNRAAFFRLLGANGISTSYQTLSGGISYTRAIGSRLQGSASVSYTSLDTGSRTGGFSGLTYSSSLTYEASSRLRFSGTISRATEPSIRLNSTYSINELYSGQASYQLSSRLVLSSGASYAHDSYRGGLVAPQPFDLTDEKIYSVFGNAEFKLNRRFSLGLNVQHTQRDANFADFSYPDTRAGLTVRATF